MSESQLSSDGRRVGRAAARAERRAAHGGERDDAVGDDGAPAVRVLASIDTARQATRQRVGDRREVDEARGDKESLASDE